MILMLIALCAYAIAMTAANLVVAALGPSVLVTTTNAFLFIGLDLTLRDWLHVRIGRLQMLALILATGALTFALDHSAGRIAVASTVAFVAAALVDWAIFSRASGTWSRRANLSNLGGAAVDSMLFPTLAFGGLLPAMVIGQFVAKVAGGAIWSLLLRQRVEGGE